MDKHLKQYYQVKAEAIYYLLTGVETFEFSGVRAMTLKAEEIANNIPTRKMPLRFLFTQIYFVIKEFFKQHE